MGHPQPWFFLGCVTCSHWISVKIKIFQQWSFLYDVIFKMAAKLDFCDLLTLKKVKILNYDCIFFILLDMTVILTYRSTKSDYLDLWFIFFSTGIFEGHKIEGQYGGRPILSINMTNWRACQNEMAHEFDFDNFDNFKVDSKVKDQQGSPIE